MKKLLISLSVVMTLMVMHAQAAVTITSQSYQKNSTKKKAKWVKATKVIPGSVVLYMNTLKNKGKDTAEKLTVVNAVPKHMKYVKGTAKCKSKCAITYSVDNGKTFNVAKKLYVKDKKTKKTRRAKDIDYTTIMWVVNKLKGGNKTVVQYKARLK